MKPDLNTAHGRAQAIADGGQAGELARVIEDALAAHSSEREALCWELLNSITVEVFDAGLWQEKVDTLYRQMCRNEATPYMVKEDLEKFAERLDMKLSTAAGQLAQAMQVLQDE